MKTKGGCYCGTIRYQIDGPVQAAFQCHCRECQYSTGGAPNMLMAFAKEDVEITQGQMQSYGRADLAAPVTRFFCATCGTLVGNHSPNRPELMILRAGTLDTPHLFHPQLAIFLCDAQPFHLIENGLPAFDKRP